MHFLFSTALLCSSQFMNSTEFLWSQIIALKSLKSPFPHYLPVDQHPNIQSSLASFLVYAAVPSYEPLDRELFYFVLLSHTLNAYSNAVLGLPDAQKTPHIAHMNFHLDLNLSSFQTLLKKYFSSKSVPLCLYCSLSFEQFPLYLHPAMPFVKILYFLPCLLQTSSFIILT